jgi:hypothetical protein
MWNMKSESPLNLIFNSRSLSLQARVGPFIRSFNFLLESGRVKAGNSAHLTLDSVLSSGLKLTSNNFAVCGLSISLGIAFGKSRILNLKLSCKT